MLEYFLIALAVIVFFGWLYWPEKEEEEFKFPKSAAQSYAEAEKGTWPSNKNSPEEKND